ncbi:hypothetical protein BT93_C0498 [Corymbia citriodora subsp. variegata]|nr:hypothetical protein BT93_C0498 [Corymbia citriodora subsp. variegata]
MGRGGGPSPLVPTLIVGALGVFILWPTSTWLVELVLPMFQSSGDDEGGVMSFVMVLLCLSLLFLIHFLTTFFPSHHFPTFVGLPHSSSSSYDGGCDGFGLGSLLFVALFFVLYNFL